MREDIMGLTTLHDLIDFDARKLNGAERQLENILPDWINKASSLSLKNVLQQYLDFVRDNIQKIKTFIAEEKIGSLSCTNTIMQAFILETREKMSNCNNTEIRDACLPSSIQGINHYKINMFGTVAAFAKDLGNEKSAVVFHQAKLNEEQIDKMLSKQAEQAINMNAANPILLSNKNR